MVMMMMIFLKLKIVETWRWQSDTAWKNRSSVFFKRVLAFFDFLFANTVALLDLLCCSKNSLKSQLFIL